MTITIPSDVIRSCVGELIKYKSSAKEFIVHEDNMLAWFRKHLSHIEWASSASWFFYKKYYQEIKRLAELQDAMQQDVFSTRDWSFDYKVKRLKKKTIITLDGEEFTYYNKDLLNDNQSL